MIFFFCISYVLVVISTRDDTVRLHQVVFQYKYICIHIYRMLCYMKTFSRCVMEMYIAFSAKRSPVQIYRRQGRWIPNKPPSLLLVLRKTKCLPSYPINRRAENKM